MNEEAIKVAYNLFVGDGYTKSIDEFKKLMRENPNGRKVAYNLFVGDGYTKGEDDFSTLMGVTDPPVKKKEPTAQEQMSEAMAPKQGGLDFVSEDSSLDLSTQQGSDEVEPEDDIYTYPTRPGAKYKRQPDGTFLINLGEKTQNKFIPIDDPSGLRTQALEKGVVPLVPEQKSYTKSSRDYGTWSELPSQIEIKKEINWKIDKEEKEKELDQLFEYFLGTEETDKSIERRESEIKKSKNKAITSEIESLSEFQNRQKYKEMEVTPESLREKLTKELLDKKLKDVVTDTKVSKKLDRTILGLDTESEHYKTVERRKKSVSKINSDIDESFKQNQYESEFVPKLREQLKSLGGPESEIFQVEEAEAGFDYVKVKNKLTGETDSFDLSTSKEGRKVEAKKLKSFIELGIKAYDRDLARKKYEDLAKRQFASPEFMSDVQEFEKRATMGTTLSVVDDILGYVFGETENEKTEDKLKEIINTIPLDYNFPNASPEERDALIEARQEWLVNSDELDNIVADDVSLMPTYYQKENLYRTKSLIKNKKKSNDIIEEKLNEISSDIQFNKLESILDREQIPGVKPQDDIMLEKITEFKQLSDEYFKNEATIETAQSNIDRAQGASYLLEQDRGSFGTGIVKKFVGGGASVIGFLRGDTGQDIYGQTYAERAMEELVPGVSTQEYFSSENRDIFTKAIFGITESVGAMATGRVLTGGVPIVKIAKFVVDGGFLGLFAQSYSQNKALMDNPEFDDVPEYEKIIMSTIYGLGVGALEKVGLGKAMLAKPAGQKLVARLIDKSFQEIPEGASAKVISEIIKRNAKETVAERGLNVLTAGGFEASTEIAQAAVMDIGLKKAYNGIKGKEYFDTPQTIGEAAAMILENGLVGFVGGSVMNSAGQAFRAAKNGIESQTEFDMMRTVATRKKNYELYKTQLEVQVLQDKMTQDQAQKSLDGLDYSLGVFNQIPENLNTSDAKEAFNLIVEKRNLESKVEGKEPNLVVKEKERITEIDNELTELGKKEVVAEEVAEPTVAEEVVTEEVAEPTVAEEVVTEEDITPRRKAETFSFDNLAEQPLDVLEEKLEESKIDIQNIEEGTVEYDAETKRIKALETEIETANQEQQELDDFRKMISEDDSSVEFRLKSKDTEGVTFDEQEAQEIAVKLDEAETPMSDIDLEANDTEMSGEVDVNELNERTDSALESTTMKTTEGLPHLFSISDALTTGEKVNSLTGKVIKNLKGAFGFNGTKGNQSAAWANVKESYAKKQHSNALKLYEDNKELFDSFWASDRGKKYYGLVPMAIVQMGSNAIISNEATFRVIQDNLTKIPKKNKVEALTQLKSIIDDKIKNPNIKEKELNQFKNIKEVLNRYKTKDLGNIVSSKFAKELGDLPSRVIFINLITSGDTLDAKLEPVQVTTGKLRGVAKTLGKGVDPRLVHLQEITNEIIDPQLKDVPIGNVVSLVGIDVKSKNQGPKRVDHPNYDWGVEGKSIGILSQPVPMESVFPKAYEKIMKDFVTKQSEAKKKIGKEKGQPVPLDMGRRIARREQLAVGMGIPSKDYRGAISSMRVSDLNKLVSFLNISFPGVVINTDLDTFSEVMSRDNVKQYLKDGEVVYGVTVDGDVYINPEVHNSNSKLFNTAIHEMGHVWTDYLKTTKKGREIYNKGAEIVQKTNEFKKQLKNFDGDVAKATDEAMAILIGNKGETIIEGANRSKFVDWLMGMWEYVKSQFKMSKDLTAQEIQDMTLDDFLGTAMADILSGKEIKLSDKQMKKLKNPDYSFRKGMSMSSIISKGRENGISNDSIKIILKERGFKVEDINQALEVSIDLFTSLPKEFANVEGGAIVGEKLFNEIKTALNKFAKSKTMSEVRQKAQELLKDNPIYKIQDEQVKLELENSLDRKLGIRKNKNVTKEIAEVRRRIKDMKEAGKSIASIQRLMRSAIRTLLPKSDNYTNANIVKLIKIVNDTKRPSEVEGQMMKVLNEVEKAREKIKNNLIDKISVIVKKKAKFKRTESGKRRGKGLDSYGQSYFYSVKKVLDLVKAKDVDGLSKFIEDNNKKYEEALQKLSNNEKLNLEYQTALDNQLAIDSFSDLMSMDLEQVEVILEEVKIARKESIARLNNRRQLRKEKVDAIKEKFNKQISEDFDVLFDEDGEPLSKNRLNRRKDNVNKSISETGLFNRVKNFLGTFRQEQKLKGNGYIRFIRNNVDHFGTITRILDRNKEGMFVKTFYERINVLIEDASKGRRNTTRKIDAMTQSIFNKDWKKWKRSLKSKESKDFKAKDVKTKKEYKLTLNKNQAMRIYALSLNEVQRKKIEAQGINIEEIKTFIGQENKALVDQVVDFLSSQYFDEINDVYVQANDINLGYVENYFPTKTVSSGADMVDFFKGDFSKQFNAEYGMTALSERIDMDSEVDLSQQIDFTSVLDNHVKSMEKYKAYALDVKQMNSILKDKSIQNLLNESGLKVLFDEMLSYSINPEAGPKVSNDIVSKVQSKYTGYALAFKAIQVVKQASSLIYAYPDYQPGPILKYIPGGRLLGLALDYSGVIATLPRQIREAREISAGFDERVKSGLEGDIQSIESGGRIAELPVRRLKRMWRKAAGISTVFGDILGILGYKAVYNRNIKNGMSKAEALRMFNNYNTTQQTKRPTEKGGLQRRVDPFSRAMTMFGSSMFLMMNNVAQSGNAMVTSIADGEPPKSKDIKKFLVNYSAGNVLFTLASYSPALLFGDDDENEAAYEALFKAATGLNIAFYIPLIGTGLELAYNTAIGKRNPLSDAVNPFLSLTKDVIKVYKDLDESESIVYSVLPIAEIMVGAQLDAPIALYQLIGEGDYSEENMYDLIGVSKSYRPGYGKTSSSSPKAKELKKLRDKLLEPTIYKSESEMKENDIFLWDKTFGDLSPEYGKLERLKEEVSEERRKNKEEKDKKRKEELKKLKK